MADETTTVDNFADPGGYSISDASAPVREQVEDVATAEPVKAVEVKAEAEPVKVAEPDDKTPAEKAVEAAKEAAPEDGKTTGEGDEPTKSAADVPVPTQAQIDALTVACEALGITETDPAKQQEALTAYREQQVAQRAEQAHAAEATRLKAAEDAWTKGAIDATNAEIFSQLKDEGWQIEKNGKDIWNPETWAAEYEDPEGYVKGLKDAFNHLRNSPLTMSFFNSKLAEGQTAFETAQAKFTETATKYTQHDPAVAAMMRDFGVSAEIFERVARSNHEHVQKAIATTNSALAAANKEVESLKAQIAGYDAAIAKAKADGRAEGQNAALEEISAGRTLPLTTGLGGTSPAPFGVKGPFEEPKAWSMEDARAVLRNGHR